MQRFVRLLSFLLLLFLAQSLFAQIEFKKDGKKEKISVKEGDLPPGDALKMAPGFAALLIRDALGKKHPISLPYYGAQMLFLETKAVRVTRESLAFEFDTVITKIDKREPNRIEFAFKSLDYVMYRYANVEQDYHYRIAQIHRYIFVWKDEGTARKVSDALNRLIYEANRRDSSSPNELLAFAASAKVWREKPESRVQGPDSWNRYRIIAEDAVRDKDFLQALENYEAALQEFPMWPEGWFNAALIYGELGEFESAVDRMKHYLELVPDAPDAKAAREKIIVWENKARKIM